ncbi:MAG: thioredoxin domain-containing protein [Cytophagales bacterium]|jgi:uncharacterized membrane protein|nr:thioredoxin domain-containing protein [Cytophagales bacterium]
MRKLISDNSVEVVKILLRRLKIPFTEYTLAQLRNHPDYPSLAAIHYVFNKLNLKTVTVKITYEELLQFPKPLVVYTHDRGGMFMVVDDLTENEIHFLDEKVKVFARPKTEFTSAWSGIAMAFEKEKDSMEEGYIVRGFQYFLKSYGLLISAFSLLALFGLIYGRAHGESAFILPFFIINAFGVFISSLILIQKYDSQNAFVQSICTSGGDSGCDNVLDSDAANLLGLFSWAEIGVTYFLSILFLFAIQPNSQSVVSVSLASIIAVPFIIYSLYQQGIVLKSWCRLCLMILFTLLLNATLASITLSHLLNLLASLSVMNIALLGLSILMIGATVVFLNRVYQELVEVKEKAKYLNKLKFSGNNFESVLKLSNKIDLSGIDPIQYGNPNAETRITIVTNPYCRPCRDLHMELFKMMKSKENTLINMIVLPDNRPGALKIAELMYQIPKLHRPSDLKSIEAYYSKYFKNPDLWIERENLNFEIAEETKGEISSYINWSNKNRINSTPVIFFNEHLLPAEYSITDLDYILN